MMNTNKYFIAIFPFETNPYINGIWLSVLHIGNMYDWHVCVNLTDLILHCLRSLV